MSPPGNAVGYGPWLALAWLSAACGSWSEPGVSVELVSRVEVSVGQQITSGSGVVNVRELSWTASEIELERCAGALGSLANWLLPSAHAHGQSSPTLLAAPSVVDGMLAAPLALGELAPPAGRYCWVRYRIAPADADARGLSAEPEMLHHSLLLRGEWGPSQQQLGGFELLSQRAFEVRREIDLELSAEHPLARLELRLDTQRWLGSLDLGPAMGAAREEALLVRFNAALEVQVE